MAELDGYLQQLRDSIDSVGWAIAHILPVPGDDSPVFAYTIGLTACGSPELLTSGLRPPTAQSLLNHLARQMHDNAVRYTHRQRLDDLPGEYTPIIIDGAATTQLRPVLAFARYGEHRVRLQQLVWPDPQHHYPWDADYDHRYDQPLIHQPEDPAATGHTGEVGGQPSAGESSDES